MASDDTNNNSNMKIESPLAVGTLNVAGLRKPRKRFTLIKKLIEQRLDVISLQETHLVHDNEIEAMAKQWGGVVHTSAGTNRSRGVATLFNPSHPPEAIKLIKSHDRMVFSSLKLDTQHIMIVSIYSPCGPKDKIMFLNDLYNKIVEYSQAESIDSIICMGDFNITLKDLDVLSGEGHSTDVRRALNNTIEGLNFIDSWRLKHPEERTYTWSRGSVARRLDYIFVSECLGAYIHDSYVKGIGFSDHRMVVTNFEFAPFKHGKGSYKLNVSLLKDTDYCNMIIDTIIKTNQEYNDLNPQLRWEMIKNNVEEVSQQYSKFLQREKRLNNNNYIKRLNILQNEFINKPNDVELQQKISKLKSELEIYEMDKAKGAQIRAGYRDIKEGERCTKYFLAVEKSRSNTNVIKRVMNASNEFIHGEAQIVEEIASQFELKYNVENNQPNEIARLFDRYIRNINLPSLDDEERQKCDEQITENAAFAALKHMNKESAPGSDGLPVEFYIVFWQQLKGPLLENYLYSFQNGHLTYSERIGILSLFHKGKDLPSYILSNWRPISLTNVDYKIIAKLFSMRVDTVIQKLIGWQQTGFMKGRQVSFLHRQIDDVLEIQRKKKRAGILLAIDFKQAFDTISIQCIIKSLKAFGFGDVFIKWITLLNTDRLACVKNGGHISRTFGMQNGVRQGCPISPQLFILAVEVLAQKIIQDKNIKGLKPNSEGRCLKVCQYADDTSLFLKDFNDMKRAYAHLDEFSKFSGLYLNLNKSFALSTNGQPIDTGDLNIQFKDTIKILGLYFSSLKSASEIDLNWTGRLNKVINVFGQWSKRNISLLGKTLVIKTYALSQFVFVMKSIALPKEVLDLLNKYCFNFLWAKRFNPTAKVTEKLKRTVLCAPKNEGGLGLWDMHHMQGSILLEWGEKLINAENSQWKEWALEFLRPVGHIQAFKSSCELKDLKGVDTIVSGFWKEVLRQWIKYNKSDKVKPISIHDPLFNNTNIRYKNKVIFFSKVIEKGCITIRDILTVERNIISLQDFRVKYGPYNGDILHYNILANGINRLNLANLVDTDKITFNNSEVGNLGRKFFLSEINVSDTPKCIETWTTKMGVTINSAHWDLVHQLRETKLKALSFKIIHGIYPSNVLLYKMNLTNTENCPLCNQTDTLEHFFFLCPFVTVLWDEVKKEINMYMGLNITLDEKIIILGANLIPRINNKNVVHINNVLAVAKLAISKYRYGPKRPILDIYQTDVNMRSIWVDYQ